MNSSDVDLDLLADYIGGALTDTPDEARVADLVSGEPAWRDAHAALSDAMAATSVQLRGLADLDNEMPVEVVDQITAALDSRSHLRVVAVGAGTSRPSRRKRWAIGVGVAAALLGFAGFGASLIPYADKDGDAEMTALPQNEAANGAGSAPFSASALPPVERITATGQDYKNDNAAKSPRAPVAEPKLDNAGRSLDIGDPVTAPDLVDPALRPLTGRAALTACLDAISAANGPIRTVESIDFARYAGAPALVVRFTGTTGRYEWVSGPKCGTPGSAADTKYQVQVR